MRVSPGALTWGGEIRIDGWCVRRRFRNGWRKEEEYVCCLFYYPRWRHISLSIRLNFKSPKIYFPKSDQKAERLQLAHVFNPQPSFFCQVPKKKMEESAAKEGYYTKLLASPLPRLHIMPPDSSILILSVYLPSSSSCCDLQTSDLQCIR